MAFGTMSVILGRFVAELFEHHRAPQLYIHLTNNFFKVAKSVRFQNLKAKPETLKGIHGG